MAGEAYFARPRPRLFGHRGAAGVAPENTLVSFERAVRDGAGYLELDVHATRDGVVVVIHDATVDRTTDGMGTVCEMTFDELRRRDAGFRFEENGTYPFRGTGVRVPSLEELLVALPDMPLNIEIKQAEPAIEGEVVSLLEEKGALGRTMLAAETDLIMRRIRACAPYAATSASYDEGRDFFERCFADSFAGYAPTARALQIPTRVGDIELVTNDTVTAAHRFGLEMHVWTVNDEAEMERLLDLGVDGVMSDFPQRLVAVAGRRQARLRPRGGR
jgi:glycerophosphoryl diester phosphodiesterase